MTSAEHSENLHLIARESRELKETVVALRSEIERIGRDGEVRLQSAVDATNVEILHLRATIRRLRENLNAAPTGDHERLDTAAFEASAEILSLETAVKRADVDPERTHRQWDHCHGGVPVERRPRIHTKEPKNGRLGSTADRHLLAGEHTLKPAAAASGELDELRETIVQLRDRLDRANVAWDEKVKAIENVGLSRRRELEETIKTLRERLQRASANCGRK
jgi:predicted  nucleic acid-binding Zn-ribbon protein